MSLHRSLVRGLPLVASLVILCRMSLAQTLPSPASLDLRCEGEARPLNVDAARPRLSWTFADDAALPRGTAQAAYRVRVATSADALARGGADLWDSGRVESTAMAIAYAGRALRAGERAFWRVDAFDATGRAIGSASPADWSTGLLAPDDWQPAKWIGLPSTAPPSTRPMTSPRAKPTTQPGSVRLQRAFALDAPPRRAMLYVTGLGQYELTLNGAKVGDALLAPGWTDYRKTVLYDAFDVTDRLRAGDNAIGLLLGNGMYHIEPTKGRYVKFTNSFGGKKAIALLRIEREDGGVQTVGTDDRWRAAPGAITYDNVFGGEDYDARLTDATADWQPAAVLDGPGGALVGASASAPPIRAIETLAAKSSTTPRPNVNVYDLGQNASIMPRLRVRGPAGSRVRIIPSELLGPDGLVDRQSCVQDAGGPAWWQFTLAGTGDAESFFPHFFYQGARYLQVELAPAEPNGALPNVESIEGVVVHSSSEPVGTFACSNDLFNRTHALVRWAQRSNMMSLMTDCPQREKLGWLEELHLNGPALRYNFRLDRLYGKQMNDMADAQLDVGLVPNIAPEYFLAHTDKLTDGFRNSPEWGSSFVIVPWQQYQFTGDDSLLRAHYARMVKYVDFLGTFAKDHIVQQGLGDWYDLGPKPPWGSQLTPPPFTATAIYYYDLCILRDVATMLGKADESAAFAEQARVVRDAFNTKFYDAEKHRYATGSQCTSAMPLVLGLCEPANREAVLQALIDDIRAHGNGLTAGDVGYRFVLRALADAGRSDVVFDMNSHSDRPGYGMQLARGATSLTEKWDASVGSFGSQNHFMLGQINEWFFHDLAGIRPATPGFEQIEIRPAIVGDVTWVDASYRSTRGLIRSAWRVDGDRIALDVTVPVGCRASVFVPTRDVKSITEGGQPTGTNAEGAVEVGSGTYRFEATR